MTTGANVNDHDEASAAAAVCCIFPRGIPYFITVTHIPVILSFFKFVPLLAAPVPVQEACADAADVADGGEDVVIVSGKRAEEGQDPSGYHGLTQASPGSGSMSVRLSTSPQVPPRSLLAPDYGSGVHQETTNPIHLPSPVSGEMRRPPSASGGTELLWYSSGRGAAGFNWFNRGRP
jgi:hypothetical protein